jgi:hypothetical protein
MRTGGRMERGTDMSKLVVDLHNFTYAPSKEVDSVRVL